MASHNLAGFAILLLISFGLALGIWAAVSKSLQGLLIQVVKLPDGATYYLRIFLLGLLLAAAAGGMGTVFDLKAGAPFMEYVWKVAAGLEGVCAYFFGFLLGYLALITVLVAVLRPKHEQ
jgi:hypothetical protein